MKEYYYIYCMKERMKSRHKDYKVTERCKEYMWDCKMSRIDKAGS